MAKPEPPKYVDIAGSSSESSIMIDDEDDGQLEKSQGEWSSAVDRCALKNRSAFSPPRPAILEQVNQNGTTKKSAASSSLPSFRGVSSVRKRSRGSTHGSTLAHKRSETDSYEDYSDDSYSSSDDEMLSKTMRLSDMGASETSETPSTSRRSRNFKTKILLHKYLPDKVAPSSLSKLDELQESLLQILKQTLKKTESFPSEVHLVDLNLPDSYSSSLENNWASLQKILCCFLTELAAKGVQKIEEVIFPQVEINDMQSLVTESLCGGIQLDSVKIPLKAENEQLVIECLPDVVEAIKPFKVPKTVFVDSPSDPTGFNNRSALWKQLQEKTVAKFLPEEDLPRVKFGRYLIIGPNTKRKGTSQLRKKATAREKETPAKMTEPQSQALFTTDGFFMPLEEVNNRITAYNYWDLRSIHDTYGYKGSRMVIAIVGSGVQHSHAAFQNKDADNSKFLAVHNFAEPGTHDCTTDHGTFCASIICGNSFSATSENLNVLENAKSIQVPPGVAPEAKLVVCQVTHGTENTAQLEAVRQALVFIRDSYTGPNAEDKVDVVSLSFASSKYPEAITRAIADLVCAGVIVVCSASNSDHTYQTPISYPARLGNVLCIGSHNIHGNPSSFSPIGQDLDFLAPGENIVGPGNLEYPNQATCGNGTSYAAPAVAGLTCLILECLQKKYPDKAERFHNHWVMKEVLREISSNGGNHSSHCGFGTLRPIRFFRSPELIVQNICIDVLD